MGLGHIGHIGHIAPERSDRRDGAWLRIRVLGGVSVDGAPGPSRASHRRLLAILLLGDGRCVPADSLVERFWPGPAPRTARAAIHTHVSALRRLVPAGLIVTEHDGYRVETSGVVVDRDDFVERTRHAHAAARSRRWVQAGEQADTALALWSGDPYAELADDDFATAEITRLQELRLQALELRAESLLHQDRARETIAELEWATRTFPLRESLSSLLALARQETGSHAEALRSLRCTELALKELGLEPSPALRDLERQILTHRRALDRRTAADNAAPLRSA